ncbi:MAG: hypothetical protein FWC27_07800, partial [Firmicutes bacterium]|nr:hypothetical protein [Bacillota bacterium]
EPPQPVYQEPAPPVWQEPAPPVYQAPVQPIYQEPVYQQPMYQQPVYQAQPAAEAPPPRGSRYAPISAGGYFGYLFLFNIPIIGLILSIVWGNDKTGSVNRQNLAKLMLVLKIIGIVMMVISGIFVAIYWNTFAGYFEQYAGSIQELPNGFPF